MCLVFGCVLFFAYDAGVKISLEGAAQSIVREIAQNPESKQSYSLKAIMAQMKKMFGSDVYYGYVASHYPNERGMTFLADLCTC